MSTRPRKVPAYRLHKPTGQAVVRLDGRDFYLGKHGTEASQERYRRRTIIERCVSRLKWFRRVATRYEKRATHYLGMVTLAIIFRLLG